MSIRLAESKEKVTSLEWDFAVATESHQEATKASNAQMEAERAEQLIVVTDLNRVIENQNTANAALIGELAAVQKELEVAQCGLVHVKGLSVGVIAVAEAVQRRLEECCTVEAALEKLSCRDDAQLAEMERQLVAAGVVEKALEVQVWTLQVKLDAAVEKSSIGISRLVEMEERLAAGNEAHASVSAQRVYELEAAHAESAKCKAAAAALENSLQSSNSSEAALFRELAKTRDELSAHMVTADLGRLSVDVIAVAEAVQHRLEECCTVEAALEKLSCRDDDKLAELEQQLVAAGATEATLTVKVVSLHSEIEAMQAEKSNLLAQASTAQQSLDLSSQELSAANTQKKTDDKVHASAIASLTLNLSAATNKIERLEKTIQADTRGSSTLTEELKTSELAVETLKQEMGSMLIRTSQLNSEIESVQSAHDAAKMELSQLQNDNTNLIEEREKLVVDSATFEKNVIQTMLMNSELMNGAQKELLELRSANELANEQISGLVLEQTTLNQELEKADRRVQKLTVLADSSTAAEGRISEHAVAMASAVYTQLEELKAANVRLETQHRKLEQQLVCMPELRVLLSLTWSVGAEIFCYSPSLVRWALSLYPPQ